MADSSLIERISITPSVTHVSSRPDHSQRPTIRVVAVFEGLTLSGPAKNLFEFCRVARTLSAGPVVDLTLLTFERSLSLERNEKTDLIAGAEAAEVVVERVSERFAFDLQVISRLRKLVERFNPDVIQTHAAKSHFLLRYSGLGKDRPWIAFHHGYTNTDFRSPIYNNLNRWSLQAPDRIVTVSQATKQQLLRHGAPGERISVMHNAVSAPANTRIQNDAAVLRQKKIELGISPDESVVLCAGRLSKEKGQINLVGAMLHLQKQRPDLAVRVMIIGDGPERGPISQAIQAAGLEGSIVFTGHLKNMTPYYEAADIVAIPSLSEGSPNVLLEAMAFGVPVVATKVGGIPEIVTDEQTALLVPARDPGAMAAAIARLLSDSGTASTLARQARQKVETEYSPETRAKALINIYEDVYRQSHP
jgi:glycosyltransferase involved in cell wall biosynthesis